MLLLSIFVETASAVPGLTGRYYQPSIYAWDNWAATGTPGITRVEPLISFDWGTPATPWPFGGGEFSADWNGFIYIPADGLYTFGTNSDDGSIVNVNAILVVDNGGAHSPTVEMGSPVTLTRGWYPIEVKYWECCGSPAVLQLEWIKPGDTVINIIPTANLNTENPDVAIPEFPTLAMPIISVIGLILVFHKRKQIK